MDGNKGSASLSLAPTSQSTKMGTVPASPIAGIPIRLARRILNLEFVEMCDLQSDSWQEETQQLLVLDPLQLAPRRLSRKAPVQDINTTAPFSVPLGRMEAVQGLRKARFERETWTYFALLYLHNGRDKIQRSAEINSEKTPLRAYRF
eukprot:Em0024g432a